MSAAERETGLEPLALASLPVFELMPAEVRQLVADSFVRVFFPFGHEIVKEGNGADAFYVVVSGRARVLKTGLDGEEISLRVVSAGDTFGEAALLDGAPRNATVRASSEVEALRLDRSVLRALLRNNPQLLRHFRLHARRNELFTFLRIESAFSRLSAEALGLMLSELVPLELDEGETLFLAGDPADSIFVVEAALTRNDRVLTAVRSHGGWPTPMAYRGVPTLLACARRTAAPG